MRGVALVRFQTQDAAARAIKPAISALDPRPLIAGGGLMSLLMALVRPFMRRSYLASINACAHGRSARFCARRVGRINDRVCRLRHVPRQSARAQGRNCVALGVQGALGGTLSARGPKATLSAQPQANSNRRPRQQTVQNPDRCAVEASKSSTFFANALASKGFTISSMPSGRKLAFIAASSA